MVETHDVQRRSATFFLSSLTWNVSWKLESLTTLKDDWSDHTACMDNVLVAKNPASQECHCASHVTWKHRPNTSHFKRASQQEDQGCDAPLSIRPNPMPCACVYSARLPFEVHACAFQSSFSASLACEPGHGKLCNPRCLCLLATPWVPMMNQEQLKVDLPLSLAAFQIIQLGSWTVP